MEAGLESTAGNASPWTFPIHRKLSGYFWFSLPSCSVINGYRLERSSARTSTDLRRAERTCPTNERHRLFKVNIVTGGQRRLRLLPGEDFRAARHGVLRSSEEGQPNHVPPPVPPYRDAYDFVGCDQVLSWGSWHLHRYDFLKWGIASLFFNLQVCYRGDQQFRSHHHVHVLPASCLATSVPQVPVVEEVYHETSNGANYKNRFCFSTFPCLVSKIIESRVIKLLVDTVP